MIASTLPMLALLRVPWGWGRAWSFTSPVGADGVENSASPDGHAADGELAAAKHAASIGSSAGGFHHCRRIVVHGIVKHDRRRLLKLSVGELTEVRLYPN